MSGTRRILVDGAILDVTAEDDRLHAEDGRAFEVSDVVHLPPVVPSKIICVHLNYRSRFEELGIPVYPAPTYFHKPVSCLNAHGGVVVRPSGCRYLNFEGEVAIVIGEKTRDVGFDEVAGHIRGYTIANDFGLHDFRETDANSMLRVKGSDTLGSVGPAVVADWDFRGKRIRTLVNGEPVQDAATDEMVWDMHYLVVDLARHLTLLPDDLILSGTPANSRPVEPGDVVTVEVEGLGSLANTIAEGSAPLAEGVGAQPSASEAVLKIALGSSYHAGSAAAR